MEKTLEKVQEFGIEVMNLSDIMAEDGHEGLAIIFLQMNHIIFVSLSQNPVHKEEKDASYKLLDEIRLLIDKSNFQTMVEASNASTKEMRNE